MERQTKVIHSENTEAIAAAINEGWKVLREFIADDGSKRMVFVEPEQEGHGKKK